MMALEGRTLADRVAELRMMEAERLAQRAASLSLNKDCPLPRPVQRPSAGNIIAFPEVGGLHHRYERQAA
jgi:hypothetical protein